MSSWSDRRTSEKASILLESGVGIAVSALCRMPANATKFVRVPSSDESVCLALPMLMLALIFSCWPPAVIDPVAFSADPIIAAIPSMVLALIVVFAGAHTFRSRALWGVKVTAQDAPELQLLAQKRGQTAQLKDLQ